MEVFCIFVTHKPYGQENDNPLKMKTVKVIDKEFGLYIPQEKIEAFIQDLNQRKYAPKSLARKLSVLKEFCKFLYSEHKLNDNPAHNILTPKQEKPLPMV